MELLNRTIILVDDGVATGATMLAAVRALRHQFPARIVIAIPVAYAETCEKFGSEVDEIVCEEKLDTLNSIGDWYENFTQLSDDEIAELLIELL